MESTQSETKPRLTLGAFLQQVRETNGLSIEYVADQLKLKISTVRDLEDNRYDRLGGLVYIKGYLRSYARLLHLNIEDQLQLGGQNKESPTTTNNDGLLGPSKQKTQRVGFWLLFLVIAVVILITALHFYQKAHQSSVVSPEKNIPTTVNTAKPVDNKVVTTTAATPAVATPAVKTQDASASQPQTIPETEKSAESASSDDNSASAAE